MSLHPNEVLLAPVVSEKSYGLIGDRKYTFKVHKDAHRTQVRQAVEAAKPKRRGLIKGTRPGWKKAIVKLKEGNEIEVFSGAQV